MKPRAVIGALVQVLASVDGTAECAAPAPPPLPDRPGAVERGALAKMEFLVGEREGTGWGLEPSGERIPFWVREVFRCRGNRDLMDMEGRFGAILADGTRAGENEYGLGLLTFDRETSTYRMWHYSSDGAVFSVPMEVDHEGRAMKYTRTSPRGTTYTFGLRVGPDGAWVSRIDARQADGSWRQVMEFRMTRVGTPD